MLGSTSYLLGQNKYLVQLFDQHKPFNCFKFWCHSLFSAPIIYSFLHPFFMPLSVPQPILENFPDTKTITDFSLLRYIEFIYLQVPDQGFLNGKTISRGNNYTFLFLKHSCFLRMGSWRVSMFSYLYFKCWQTRGSLLNSWNGYQKLYINRVW